MTFCHLPKITTFSECHHYKDFCIFGAYDYLDLDRGKLGGDTVRLGLSLNCQRSKGIQQKSWTSLGFEAIDL